MKDSEWSGSPAPAKVSFPPSVLASATAFDKIKGPNKRQTAPVCHQGFFEQDPQTQARMCVWCAASFVNLYFIPNGLSTCMSVPWAHLWQCLPQNEFAELCLASYYHTSVPRTPSGTAPPRWSTVTCVTVSKPQWLLDGMRLGVEFLTASILMHWEAASAAELCLAEVEARSLLSLWDLWSRTMSFLEVEQLVTVWKPADRLCLQL